MKSAFDANLSEHIILTKISSLPHTWRNLPHGEALWTFTKTTHQNGRFLVKVKQKLKNLKQQRFMWDQKVASTAVNDWKQCIFSGIHRWNMRSSHAAGDFQLRSYSPQSLLSSVPGLFQAVVGLGKKSPASELGKVGRYTIARAISQAEFLNLVRVNQ